MQNFLLLFSLLALFSLISFILVSKRVFTKGGITFYFSRASPPSNDLDPQKVSFENFIKSLSPGKSVMGDIFLHGEDPPHLLTFELKEELESFFSGIHSSFLHKSFKKLASENDCTNVEELVSDYYGNFPYETMEAVNNIGDLEFMYFIVRVLFFSYYPHFKAPIRLQDLEVRKIDSANAFDSLFYLTSKYFRCSNNQRRDTEYHQKFLNLITLILWRMDCSHRIIIIPDTQFLGLKEFSISAKDLIDTLGKFSHSLDTAFPMENAGGEFVRNLETESAIGFEKAYYSLRTLPLKYSKDKNRILSLIFTCIYYALVIFEVGFKSMEPKTVNPKMLIFLLRLHYLHTAPRQLFSLCRSNEIDYDCLEFFRTKTIIAILLKKYKFESNPHQNSLANKMFEGLETNEGNIWLFKVYLALIQFNY
jgi:hypothetical protein